jgi:hypothetical protein
MATDTDSKLAFEYAGEKVTFNWNHKFVVAETGKVYDNAQAAKDAIDRRQADVAKIKKPVLALAAIDDAGKEYTVTGIHAGNNKLLTKPAHDRWSMRLYAACPKVRRLVAEKMRLDAQVEVIKEELESKFKINDSWPSIRPLSENYATLEKDYEAAIRKGKE